jgi:hypothetical protein
MKKVKEQNDDLNLYEAACLVKMSPGLLKWLTSYAPKHGDGTKLKSSGKIGDIPTFKKKELIEFSQWLHKPWPVSSTGARPNIPKKIKEEIVKEAGTTCAICHGHAGTCEAAHIDPVHKSNDNHPHNLIWLCANHHTAYDKGLFGPKAVADEFVKALKETMLQYSVSLHATYADAIKQAFYLLEAGKRAAALVTTSKDEIDAVEAIGALIVADVLTLTTKTGRAKVQDKKRLPLFDKLADITKTTEFVNATSAARRLHALEEVHDEFQAAAGMVECPLCKGEGIRFGESCTFCGGDKQVDKRFARNFDSRDYDFVDCPACKGKGHFGDYEQCPECGGNCQMERRFADLVSLSKYKMVDCPCCDGVGIRNNDDCPYCKGNRKIKSHYADVFDSSLYDDVRCDVCNGKGWTKHYNACPKCNGNGTVTGEMHENRNKRNYEFVTCPDCAGKGVLNEGDCPRCNGEGNVPRFILDYY